MNEIKDIENAINELQKKLKFPNCELQLSEKYDLHSDFNDYYPNCNDPGAYLLLDEEETVLYIGKASCKNTLGSRLGERFKKSPDNPDRGLAEELKFEKVRYIVTIPLPPDHAFVAPLVEEYFLYHSTTTIRPRLNKHKG